MITDNMNSANNEGNHIIHNVGMTIALVSFAMLFMTLLMGLAIFRFTNPVWPPQGMIRPSLVLPICSTITIFLSSLSFIWFEKNTIQNKSGLIATFVLGLLFMLIQFMFWNSLQLNGLVPSSGIFASIIYAFTWIHAGHIVLALGLLLWLLLTFSTTSSNLLSVRVSSIGKFWHFLGFVWLILFVTIFVF